MVSKLLTAIETLFWNFFPSAAQGQPCHQGAFLTFPVLSTFRKKRPMGQEACILIDLFVPSAPLTPTDLIFHWILGDVSTKYSYLLEEFSGDFSSLSFSAEFTGIFFQSGSGHYKQFLLHF